MAYGQGNYGGGNRRSGSSYGGGRGSFGGGNRGGFGGGGGGGFNKPSFNVQCDQCGNACTVPFKPNGSKPVLCSDCFRGSDQGSDSRNSDRRPSFGRFNDRSDDRPRNRPSGPAPIGPSLKSEIMAINAKLDRILSMLNDAVIETEEQDETNKISFEDESQEIE